MIPFRQRRKESFYRGKEEKKHTTCTFILQVFMLLFDRMKNKNDFALRRGGRACPHPVSGPWLSSGG